MKKQELEDLSGTVSVVWATPQIDELLAYMARVSNPANQNNPNIKGLLHHMMEEGHVSPFDMCNVTFEINTTRDIGRQLLRHWSIKPQEFCVAEGTLITTMTKAGIAKKIAIEDLYRYQHDPRMQVVWDRGIRVFDLNTKEFVRSTIKEVFSTGRKECFDVTLSDDKVLRCTAEHKLLGRGGFVRLGDLAVGDLVAVNGQELYKSYDWMLEAKARSLVKDGGITQIAAEAGCSYHTIRKWLKAHNLKFSKKESSIVAGGAWNKGLSAELQPMFGKLHSTETRQVMAESARKGEDSNLYGGDVKRKNRQLVTDWQHKWRNHVHVRDGSHCVKCGSTGKLELDHKLPVSTHPELAKDVANLQLLCVPCHKVKSVAEMVASRLTVRWKSITSIVSVGEQTTYDLEVVHDSHNFVANGIVTHNSQRYQSVDKLGGFVLREFREQDTKNRQASVEVADDDPRAVEWLERQKRLFTLIQADYDWMLSVGGAKEQARVVLPEGCTRTRMYFNGTLRSWIHYIGERKKGSTQKEHQKIARAVLELLRTAAPVTMEAFFPTEPVKETIQIPLDGFKQVLKGSLAYMKLEVDERSVVYVLHKDCGQAAIKSIALSDGGNVVYADMQEVFEHQRIKDFAAVYLTTPLDRSEFDNLQGLLNTRSNCGKSTVVYVVAGDGW